MHLFIRTNCISVLWNWAAERALEFQLDSEAWSYSSLKISMGFQRQSRSTIWNQFLNQGKAKTEEKKTKKNAKGPIISRKNVKGGINGFKSKAQKNPLNLLACNSVLSTAKGQCHLNTSPEEGKNEELASHVWKAALLSFRTFVCTLGNIIIGLTAKYVLIFR